MEKKAIEVTPEVWGKIQGKLLFLGDSVELRCDSYKVEIVLLGMKNSLKNVLVVYVNGEFKGEWLLKECEEQRRFLRLRTQNLYSAKQLQVLKKIYSKRELNAMAAKKSTYYDYKWTSFRSLKNHLVKNNEVIEWMVEVDDGEKEQHD